MGGGDLNLKKSWHPSTMRNMEKVWQAEQRHEAEQKRIAELQRELREEREREEVRKYAEDQGVIEKRDGTKLDWMYQGPGGAVDREEYLLGRAVDKNLEEQLQAERSGVNSNSRMHPEYDGMPASILKGIAGASTSNEQVDMVRKMQEDPLSAIRKKEIETKTQLLSNPVKLKQLQQMLQDQKKQSKHKKHKKDKKHKKKKKHRHHSNDSSESEVGKSSELDRALAAKYSRLRRCMERSELEQVLAPEASTSDEELQTTRKQTSYDSDDDRKIRKKSYGLVLPAGMSKQPKGDRKRSRSPHSKNPTIPQAASKQDRKAPPRKLTEEEKAARLQEMQANASWRDEERNRNVKRYREEDRKEKEHHEKRFDKKFINKELSKAAAQSTVEDRIRSNRNYIQRSGAAMDKNFARR